MFRQGSIKKEHACFKYLVGALAKKEKKKGWKRVVLKNRDTPIFRDNNHQRLYNIKLHNKQRMESRTS